MWLLSLWLACRTPPLPPSPPSLTAPDADERLDAFLHLDVAGMRAEADTLLQMAKTEPDPFLRREVVRQLGVTRDPRAIALLVSLIGGPDELDALESLGYGGEAGCAAFAEAWVAAPLEAHRRYSPMLRRQPQCEPAFRARCATDPERMRVMVRCE